VGCYCMSYTRFQKAPPVYIDPEDGTVMFSETVYNLQHWTWLTLESRSLH
jgi:hypothetical protein